MSAGNARMYAPPQPNARIKQEHELMTSLRMNGSAPMHKLSSLTPARDLTLGGRGGPNGAGKKVFTPNLNVTRNKNANVKTSKDTSGRGRGRGRGERGGPRGAHASRGGRGGGAALIQTAGVFSEGAGAVNIRKTIASGSYTRNADDTPSMMRKPTLLKDEHKKIDLKMDAMHVRELLGDSDDDDFVDTDKTDLEQIPVKLNEAKWKALKNDIKMEIPSLEGLEFQSLNDEENTLAIAQKIQTMHVQQQEQQKTLTPLARYPLTVEELLQSRQSQIFVMQLPDTLPCEEEASPDKEKTNDVAPSDTPASSTKPPSKKSRSLKQMDEGQVGKILRYKSGKVKLQLGETYFDLDMGMETGFLQDLMSISTNREERSGNMINLGPIQAKLTATPDWEHLLRQQTRQEPT